MIISLVVTTGFHWAALQSVAWAAMLASNLRKDTVAEAVTRTFDGQHPCALCKAIAAGKKSEEKKDISLKLQKLEFPLVEQSVALIAPTNVQPFSRVTSLPKSVLQRPPTPPPRRLPALA